MIVTGSVVLRSGALVSMLSASTVTAPQSLISAHSASLLPATPHIHTLIAQSLLACASAIYRSLSRRFRNPSRVIPPNAFQESFLLWRKKNLYATLLAKTACHLFL